MKDLDRHVNHANALAGGIDKAFAVHTLLKLHEAGYRWNVDPLCGWALARGFTGAEEEHKRQYGPFGKLHVRFGKGAHTSGPRPRRVPMLDGLDLVLRWFLEAVRPEFPSSPVLFADESGGPLTTERSATGCGVSCN